MGGKRRGRVLTAFLVVAVGASGAACGTDPEPPPSPYVNAAEVCEGVFAGRLEKTVQEVTGGTVFNRSEAGSMGKVIEEIKKGHASGRSWSTGQKLCNMSVKGIPSDERASVSFNIYAPRDVGDPRNPEGARRFLLGREAVANTRWASLYFECVSPQLEKSDRFPARIRGGLGNAKIRGNAVEDLVANLTVLHAASLAVAKELECEGNGGLPEKLDPGMKPLS
ncbi:hypothetical protein ACIOD0_05590 [Kitasatospora albolonga]